LLSAPLLRGSGDQVVRKLGTLVVLEVATGGVPISRQRERRGGGVSANRMDARPRAWLDRVHERAGLDLGVGRVDVLAERSRSETSPSAWVDPL
jgi:hypothetical protein